MKVKVKIRPNQTLQFPGICVHCAQPAAERLELKKRIGRVTRIIDVPLCVDCAHQIQRLSAEEERWQKLGWLAGGIVFFLTLALVLLFSSAALGLALRLLTALSLAALLGAAVAGLFWRVSRRAALPAKKAIYASAGITAFSWRATTFNFSNEIFAERFRSLNESSLIEV